MINFLGLKTNNLGSDFIIKGEAGTGIRPVSHFTASPSLGHWRLTLLTVTSTTSKINGPALWATPVP